MADGRTRTRNQTACKYFDRLPNGEKTNFLVIDFWQNDFGRQVDDRVPSDMPLLTRLFNTRLDILAATLNRRTDPAFAQAIADCRTTLARVPVDSFLVRKAWPDVESAWTDDFWLISPPTARLSSPAGRPLLRFVPDVDVAAETFTNRLNGSACHAHRYSSPNQLSSIAEDVSRLPQEISSEPQRPTRPAWPCPLTLPKRRALSSPS